MNQEVTWLLLFVVRGLARARRLPIIRKRPKREDRIRQEVHVLRVVRVQVSLNNISQNERGLGKERRHGRTQGTEAPSASEGDVKMPTKDQAVTESRIKQERQKKQNTCAHEYTHTDIRPLKKKKKYCESTTDEIRQSQSVERSSTFLLFQLNEHEKVIPGTRRRSTTNAWSTNGENSF